MKVASGYVLSKKGGYLMWRRLPRQVWHRIQRERLIKIAQGHSMGGREKPIPEDE